MSHREFSKTYIALVSTLVDTYHNKDLAEHLHEYKQDPRPEIAILFWEEIKPFMAELTAQDPVFFSRGIAAMDRLTLTSLWSQNKLTVNSQAYVWSYLKTLARHARASIENGKQKDIAPPPKELGKKDPFEDLVGMEQLKGLYDKMPRGLLDKVKDVTDKYGAKIESGEETLDSINFDQISKELMASISSEEMSGLIGNIGSVLGSVMKDRGDSNIDMESLASLAGLLK